MSRLELNMSMDPATTETEEIVVDEIANISVPLTNVDVNFENSQLPLDMNMKNINSCNNDSSEKFLHELQVGSMSFEQMQNEIEKLTLCQKKVMKYITNFFKRNQLIEPFKIFITGGGGVGKSHLTRLVINWLRLCTSKQFGVDTVMVCAPTGTAAKNINGKTLHSALNLPVQHGSQPELTQLSAKCLKKIRS